MKNFLNKLKESNIDGKFVIIFIVTAIFVVTLYVIDHTVGFALNQHTLWPLAFVIVFGIGSWLIQKYGGKSRGLSALMAFVVMLLGACVATAAVFFVGWAALWSTLTTVYAFAGVFVFSWFSARGIPASWFAKKPKVPATTPVADENVGLGIVRTTDAVVDTKGETYASL